MVENIRKEAIIERNGNVRQAGADPNTTNFAERLRVSAEQSLYFFCTSILGYSFLSPNLHRWVCEFLQKCPPFRKLLLLPRLHAKTLIVSHSLPLHILIQSSESNVYTPGIAGEDHRILLCCESERLAKDRIRVLQSHCENNELLRGLWPHRVWESPSRQAGVWNATEMVLPRANEYPDPSIRGLGVGGAITGARPSIEIKDDIISIEAANSEIVMQSAIDWHKASRALLEKYEDSSGLQPIEMIIGCLTADTKILMEDGTYKCISAVGVCDRVWAADVDKSMTCREIVDVIPQGFAKTVTVKTTASEVRATHNHPFLVSANGRDLAWRKACDLRVNDLIVSCKEIGGVSIPSSVDEEFCWMLGMMYGDGWIAVGRRGYVCFSPGVDDNQNSRMLRALTEKLACNKLYMTSGGYYRTDSNQSSQKLYDLGFAGNAYTKRLPLWVFSLPPQYRRALIQGFCDSAGAYWGHCTWNVEIVNKELLEDFRWLAMLCGVRTGIISSRTRTIQAPNSKRPITSTFYRSSFNFATVDRKEVVGYSPDGFRNVGRATNLPSSLRFDRVVSISENLVEEEVYDLTVEGTPSFFANGLAVHNTRWSIYDLYSDILDNDPTVSPVVRSIIEDGKLIWPERWSMADVERLRLEQGDAMFSLLYMNNPYDASLVAFDMSLVRYFVDKAEEIDIIEDERDDTLRAKFSPADNISTKMEKLKGKPLKGNKDIWSELGFLGRDAFLRDRYADGAGKK